MKKPPDAPRSSPSPSPAAIAASAPPSPALAPDGETAAEPAETGPLLRVRRIHRRDLGRVWEFLKLVFRDVNRETVEYQRPRSKKRFLEVYEEDGIEQLLFEHTSEGQDLLVGYAECRIELSGNDNWINERYFSNREMRPLFVEELAVHPAYQGRGVGGFALAQLEHLARLRGCTHLVLEVAENNDSALKYYRKRSFHKLDAAIFMAKRVEVDADLLPPRPLAPLREPEPGAAPRKRPKSSKTSKPKTRG